jgi:c-di-GMP-related signal transduction protein
LLNKDEIIINRFAQEKINLEEILIWFENLNSEEQIKTISTAKLCLEQAHPNKEVIEKGIENVPLKPTATPIVLLKSKGFKIALNKIVLLPKDENKKVFITLISIFKFADIDRRETWCKDGCSHEWHNLT